MDDEIPHLSNDVVQFLRAISSPEQDNAFPLTVAGVGDLVHLHNDLQQSDDTDHESEHDQNQNQRNRDRDGSNEEFRRRRRRHGLRLRLRDLGLSAGRHDRILDWAELLLQLEDQSVTFGQQRLEFEDSYIRNPDDYVDETVYESLLQTLADSDGSGRRGSPPASKSVVEGLQTVEVKESSSDLCAVCNDKVFNNEDKVVKQLPCGHLYHGICITPWLNSTNTCPVCRHELPTDDPEYEETRRRRSMAVASAIS